MRRTRSGASVVAWAFMQRSYTWALMRSTLGAMLADTTINAEPAELAELFTLEFLRVPLVLAR